jgi:hypothetical protein
MTKLSIAIDMGAKNNGVFIVKSDKDKIVDKKATTIIIDKGALNFLKKAEEKTDTKIETTKEEN